MIRFIFKAIPYYHVAIVILVIISCCVKGMSCQEQNIRKKNESVPAIFVFGDSIVDTGNNNYIKTIAKCNFPPYGRDFAAGGYKPNGRFSNGLVPSDFIAEIFGVKDILPPYLDPNLQLQELLTGVSFASGGAGYDPLTSKAAGAMSLSDQLDKLGEYQKKIREAVGENRAETIVSKSIYIVCLGSDDIANTYLPFRQSQYDIPSYTDLMASLAFTFLKELYGVGARRIGVVSMPIIGCVPSQRTVEGGINRACSDFENQAAILFNMKLLSQTKLLNKQFPDARIVYLDIYNTLDQVIQNPAQYDFEVVDKGCCGTGIIEASMSCNSLSINTCTDDSNYIFWDSYHPTEKAYKLITSMVLRHKINDFF
ncbi:GDSL esterase/lipase EXL3-like isoform X1 [Arachis hypogaea]|nr:GDSL esterase/lipase EXL3-like isoform X1 [Arachis hypogaea]XP_025698318.1 GDSL esterase/lipase EXL3-like isoform X1 [Arachis hypogaea]QHO40372.1 GDSL esterase/lipase [Arachis hypogaea]